MKFFPSPILRMAYLVMIPLLLFSCTKDSDLFMDAVFEDSDSKEIEGSHSNSGNSSAAEESSESANDSSTAEAGSGAMVSYQVEFSPKHDVYVEGSKFFDQDLNRIEEGNRQTLLKFDLDALNNVEATVTSVELVVYVSGDDGSGVLDVYRGLDSEWDESTTTTSKAPEIDIHLGNTSNKNFSIGHTEKIKLSEKDILKGENTFIITHTAGNDLAIASKEHASGQGPKLIINYEAPEGNEIDGSSTETSSESTSDNTDAGESQNEETSYEEMPYFGGELKAFPGAEGFGKYATGGRGGIIVEVTNLNDSGAGSLREALSMTVPRTIVFKVGGTIECNDYLSIPANSGDVTIAGETAPGDGILIKNGELRIQASNVILRYMRFRNSGGSGTNLDGIKIRSYSSSPLSNVIIDHVSVSWAKDENISITNAENVTIQNSIIGESLYGLLIQNSKKVSILNNLFALNSQRNILANTSKHNDLTFEMMNNLVYGFNWGTSGTYGMAFNVLNNKYRSSNDFESTTDNCVRLVAPNAANGDYADIATTHAYVRGNIYDGGVISEFDDLVGNYLFESPKFASTYAPSPADGLESKLMGHVGASFPSRDAVDASIINKYNNAQGEPPHFSHNFPQMSGGNAYLDSDEDGIADEWETRFGLDPFDSADGAGDRNADGYTNLETFLHMLING